MRKGLGSQSLTLKQVNVNLKESAGTLGLNTLSQIWVRRTKTRAMETAVCSWVRRFGEGTREQHPRNDVQVEATTRLGLLGLPRHVV